MKSIKLQSLLGISTCALLLASASAWGATERVNAATPMPLIQEPQTQSSPAQAQPDQSTPTQTSPSQAQPDQSTPNQNNAAKSTTFTGTIMKDGEQWVLRDSSGSVYKLDDSSRAQAFEGKTVKVTGRLDADSKMIHVDTIQALAS